MPLTLARSEMIEGKLYDGVTAYPHDVRAEFDETALTLTQEGGWSDRVELSQLTMRESGRGVIRIGQRDVPGWGLVISEGARAEVEALLGRQERYGRWIDRVGLLPALAVGMLVTATAVGIGYMAPEFLAPHVPMSWERNLGSAMVGDFGELRCRSPDGQRALEQLVERVAPGATSGPDAIKVAALDVPVFNAAALPGGYIVVFKPAITESEPEALAGILAHEVAHVRRRHVTEALLRELGIGALIRLFAGDIGMNAEQLVALSYTREDELQADSDSIRMLKRAHISPKPTAALFQHLSEEQAEGSGFGAEFLQSHPLSGKRARTFEASFDPKASYRPALGERETDALFNVCWNRPENQ